MSNDRSVPVQEIQSNHHLNNTGNRGSAGGRFTKQIHFNLNNVNQYYNNSRRHTTDVQSVSSLPKSIGYNTCNNNTINNKTKPYRNNLSCSNRNDNNNQNNNNTSYIEYLHKPIKMQREEIIIEHSQLVSNGNGNENTNATNPPSNRSNHYTQVSLMTDIEQLPKRINVTKKKKKRKDRFPSSNENHYN